ncbi:MAG: sigma-70 family RNA polymerase sigma factor [Myxococcales bacterium]|nr:sigma-70 family RNA polymerase sigma factor [Myxococcales bacterium]MCB9714310.1 sigma-70 family RNA polymerase sigma factor [Myxococcales bacterium]
MLDASERERRELHQQVVEAVHRTTHFTLLACQGPPSMVEDLVHEILAYLFRRNGAVLRSWDPQRASFRGYLGMIASRFVRRRLGNRLVIISLGDIGLAEVDDADIDDLLAYRAALEEILAWLDARNGDHDRERFNALFIDGRSAADIAAGEGVTADAIYTWKSRLRGRIAKAFPHVVELLRSGARSGKRHGGDES